MHEASISSRKSFYLRRGKRIFDALASLVGLTVISPLLGVCALVVRLDSTGPIFFQQERVGEHGKLFRIFKLRTMVHDADKKGPRITASGDSRITRVGKWLRKMKLDEFPQLLNVLRGEMSFVGPRPEVPEYVATYTPEQRRLLEFKPGITGPAALTFIDEEQVLASLSDKESFYVSTVLAKKLELDLTYCESMSFLGDLKFILATLARPIKTTKPKRGSF